MHTSLAPHSSNFEVHYTPVLVTLTVKILFSSESHGVNCH